jgi:hypothetical protein
LVFNPQPHKHREYKVVAESREIDYTEGFLGQDRRDPLGLVYRVTAHKSPGGDWEEIKSDRGNPKPMVLRMIEGEYITIHLTNNIKRDLKAEPHRPEGKADVVAAEDASQMADVCRQSPSISGTTARSLTGSPSMPTWCSSTRGRMMERT